MFAHGPRSTQDWIGLKQLVDQGRVDWLELAGGHMSISLDFFVHDILEVYCRGTASSASSGSASASSGTGSCNSTPKRPLLHFQGQQDD